MTEHVCLKLRWQRERQDSIFLKLDARGQFAFSDVQMSPYSDMRKMKSDTSPANVKGKQWSATVYPSRAQWKRRYALAKNRLRQMKCEARGRRIVDLAGTKAEVEETEVRFTAGIAARRGSTWRGPPEMTALRQDITASPYRTFLLLSLIGLLLQIHSATGKPSAWIIPLSVSRMSLRLTNEFTKVSTLLQVSLTREIVVGTMCEITWWLLDFCRL